MTGRHHTGRPIRDNNIVKDLRETEYEDLNLIERYQDEVKLLTFVSLVINHGLNKAEHFLSAR